MADFFPEVFGRDEFCLSCFDARDPLLQLFPPLGTQFMFVLLQTFEQATGELGPDHPREMENFVFQALVRLNCVSHARSLGETAGYFQRFFQGWKLFSISQPSSNNPSASPTPHSPNTDKTAAGSEGIPFCNAIQKSIGKRCLPQNFRVSSACVRDFHLLEDVVFVSLFPWIIRANVLACLRQLKYRFLIHCFFIRRILLRCKCGVDSCWQ